MNRSDLAFGAALAALALALLAPSGLHPGFVPANFGDLFSYHAPMRHLGASGLQEGRLPFWNPYIFAGLPLAANSQLALFYPLSALSWMFPLSLALSWDCLFHWLWGALGVAALARSQRLNAACAWTLAFAYLLSPMVFYRIVEGIPTLLASLSWIPWCWLFWCSGRRGWLAACFALQFLSGHPQFLVINAIGMTVYAAIRRERQGVVDLTVAGASALALAAVQWVPTLEFIRNSIRSTWPKAYSMGYSISPSALWTVFDPNALGNPFDGSYAGPPSMFFESGAMHVGIVALALALWGWRGGRARWASGALVLGGIALALGQHNPLYARLADGPLGFLRTPARYLLLSFWGLLLAAGAGLRALGARLKSGSRARLLVLLLLLLELGGWAALMLGGQDATRYLGSNRTLAQQAGGREFRVMTDPELANPNKTMFYRIRNVNGYEAYYLAGFPEYAARSEQGAAVDSSRSYLSRHDTPEMNRLSVAYKIQKDGSLLGARGALSPAYYLDAAGRPIRGRVPLAIVSERPERWSLAGTWPREASRLVIAQQDFPGWNARLDGRPAELERWDGLLQSLRRPSQTAAGSRFRLRLEFVPTGFALWALISIGAWAAWLRRRALESLA